MSKKNLPIGIQTFEKIIEGNYVYVDKTQQALEVINRYQYVFLSRPRRFGKSLFVDTLFEIFSGNKELFKGLYIYDKYDFEPYPVIRLSWGGDFTTEESTERVARSVMDTNQNYLGIKCAEQSPDICFKELIINAYEKYNKRVVILIDEYDKPILDNIGNIEEAKKRRQFLRSLYVQMKENDRYIRFVFLTGISKFSKASIFSDLNNVEDISLNSDFATICGYTQNDLETVFAEYLQGADKDKVKEWYNGYNFLGENVYNPFDILLFIRNKFRFSSYWWKSGTPFSLIQMLKSGNYYLPELQNVTVSETLLDSFDIEDLQLEPLLYQAGYLTIENQVIKNDRIFFKLKVPNIEVQISLNELLANYLTQKINYNIQDGLYNSLENAVLEDLQKTLFKLFASIPYTNYVKNNISTYEGYYSSVVYTYLTALGFRVIAEDVTDRGRIDLTMFVKDKIYVIEFKVGGADALAQIKQKAYHEKYLSESKEIYLIGINFDDKERNISKFEWEKV